MPQQIQTTAEEAALANMDEDFFQTLYEQYNRRLYNFFANREFSREESRDLVQETFMAAYDSRASFRGDSHAGAWLLGIATNVWRMKIRHLRRIKRDAPVVSLDHPAAGEDTDRLPARQLADDARASRQLEKCLADERIRLLYLALHELPEKMRLCVVLHLREYKYRQIAEILGVSINTVRRQLYDAREKLKKRLTDHFLDLSPLDPRGSDT